MKRLIIILALLLAAFVPATPKARYETTCKLLLLKASKDSAVAQVGVREATGRNDGYAVERYLYSVGLGKGYPYCAAGQYWSFYAACSGLGLPPTEIPIARTGLTTKMFNEARKRGVKTPFKPKINDLLFWINPNGDGGHVERIIEVGKAGWVVTVGFNTSSGNAGSQNDGGGVHIRKRNLLHFLGRMAVRGSIGFRGTL